MNQTIFWIRKLKPQGAFRKTTSKRNNPDLLKTCQIIVTDFFNVLERLLGNFIK
ncbi:hypothetical protein LEP1GSC132_1158 [Leptospira kirschneri str. 200803703]|nr:hypothetical protein LEP1GSC132_1158 [Leptospira kirschneri str. 200803703]